ncbi:sugar ABC transporter ATP-binding protein [Paraclostridium sordellii]|uniref:sugar ABC transporter ATP-binding protein n=1 Tax=Paraclostridium sordellii TaxID=1505 RepID=UPI0005DE0BA7|nr:sugar ABC transporter ATP-binding protein [Paeniclostridium sordellii]CEN93741.1 ABC transporter [[Clostridium] sordellii] [Paeniclostridium sordellii]CEN95100.1 ABC transporter [[Clostridium] sordellii] [Paeniclostridium sordellii]
MNNSILKLENIVKEYPGVKALDKINLEFEKGKIHSIVGENGAGKSTFIKIITGAEKQNSGKLIYKNKEILKNSPNISMKMGINCVYQELNLIPYLTVAENIFYGYEQTKGLFLDKKSMNKKSEEILKSLGVNIDVKKLVKDIGIGNQQIVEIAKSIIKNLDVLILDEPTASLTKNEIDKLFEILYKLKADGVSIIYISHRLDEVLKISDDISVFMDGKLITTKENCELDKEKIIKYMVGRDLDISKKTKDYSTDETVLTLDKLTSKYIKDVSFDLKKGEIIGIAGLVSSGRTELANAIFGVDKVLSGSLSIKGKTTKINNPSDAIKNGLAFITEDRKDSGLILEMGIKENASLASLNKFTKGIFIDKNKQTNDVSKILKDLKLKYSSIKEHVNNLSGGNQQKVVIAKWLITNSDIIIFDEPTRGIDVGAKEEVYKIIEELVENGKSIIMISSEMEEIFRMSNRILVMSNGHVVSEYKNGEVSSEQIFIDSASLLRERDYEK